MFLPSEGSIASLGTPLWLGYGPTFVGGFARSVPGGVGGVGWVGGVGGMGGMGGVGGMGGMGGGKENGVSEIR